MLVASADNSISRMHLKVSQTPYKDIMSDDQMKNISYLNMEGDGGILYPRYSNRGNWAKDEIEAIKVIVPTPLRPHTVYFLVLVLRYLYSRLLSFSKVQSHCTETALNFRRINLRHATCAVKMLKAFIGV